MPGGGAAFVAAKGVGAQMAERLLTLGWRGGLELLPALLLVQLVELELPLQEPVLHLPLQIS